VKVEVGVDVRPIAGLFQPTEEPQFGARQVQRIVIRKLGCGGSLGLGGGS